ncbi:DUF2550 domain-containing protein [Luteococcus sediminum]|uniref:DUF2550 domain-containing protein n=1 Tax=Luteococcus sp. TaxID=1969402 RepID=UPI003735D8D0
MEWWQAGAGAVFAVLLALLLPLVALYLRRRWLSNQGGVFDCALRRVEGAWSTGVARYHGDELEWYRIFSFSMRPKVVLRRDLTRTIGRRRPTNAEGTVLFNDVQILGVASRTRPAHRYELAMGSQSITGLMSWLEAAPPGGDSYNGLE